MAALCFVAFTYIKIPIPVPGGDTVALHIGNAFCVLAALLLGGVYGGLAGSLGMTIADLIDPTYVTIYQGQWRNDAPYGVTHRICVAAHQRGVASFCLNWCFEQCGNLKIDTHRDNTVMQNLLQKNGFVYCGIIHLANGAERLAYQKG